jgi:hypothetical protein
MVESAEIFLKKDVNSKTRESILTFRILYDLKLAAALSGYDLSCFISDVDRDGFDIVLDDLDSLRKIQLKSVAKSSSTSTWNIHRSILRPDMSLCEMLGYEPTTAGTGVQGAVILIEFTGHPNYLDISYFYTDIFVITALELGVVRRERKINRSVFAKFRSSLQNGKSTEKIAVPKSLFVKAKGPEHLLGLLAFHNRISYVWWQHLLKIGEDRFHRPVLRSELPAPLAELPELVAKNLVLLTDDLREGGA